MDVISVFFISSFKSRLTTFNPSLSPFLAVLSDMASLRSANPDLKLLISVGGAKVKGLAFSTLASEAGQDSLANLTASIGDLRKDEVIDGVEVDWEWPTQFGDKKDKTRLVSFIRVSTYIRRVQAVRV